MAQEERIFSSGWRVGGSDEKRLGNGWNLIRSSKKQKPKKPPQRGLGVAQLERLRLEEQQKNNDSTSFYPSPSAFSQFTPPTSFISNIPNAAMDVTAFVPAPSPSVKNYNEFDAEMRSRFTNHDAELMNYEPEDGLKMNLPNMTEHSTQLPNYQLEPPSNQSHVAPFRPWEEKVTSGGCAKRSYPFSLENPPAPYFPFKLHKVGNLIPNRAEESSSFSRIDNVLRENFREGPSRSSSALDSSSTDSVKENKVSDSGYLTLAPPVPPSRHLPSSASRRYSARPGFEFPPYPGYPVGFVYRHAPRWTGQPPQPPFHQPYYNFFPPVILPNHIEDSNGNEESKETSEGVVDLNLKL